MNPLFDLIGQIALVTGASRGLGQYFARALANAGADLILTSRRKDDLLPFVAQIEALGRRAVPLALDVRNHQSILAMAEAAEAACPRIHILVNNAGCNVRKPALDVTWDDWNLILDTNLRGSFFVAQQIAKRMVPRGYGRIVNIGSVTSVFGYAGLAPYGASRGGIRQLTMSLADDWGKHGITVNCLAPGWFRTDQNKVLYDNQEWVDYLVDRIPLKRPGEPHDLHGAVVFLASEEIEPLHHRPDNARRWRHHYWLHARHGQASRCDLDLACELCNRLRRNPLDLAKHKDVAEDSNHQVHRRNRKRPHILVRRGDDVSRDDRRYDSRKLVREIYDASNGSHATPRRQSAMALTNQWARPPTAH